MATKKLDKGTRNATKKKTPPKKRVTKAAKVAPKKVAPKRLTKAEKAAAQARSEAALRAAETRRKNKLKKEREEKQRKKRRSEAAKLGWETRREKEAAEALATQRAERKKRRDALARGRSRLRGEDDKPEPKPRKKPKKKTPTIRKLKPGEVTLKKGDRIVDILAVPELFGKNVIILKEGETAFVRATDRERALRQQRVLDEKDAEIDAMRDDTARFKYIFTLRNELDLFMAKEELLAERGLKLDATQLSPELQHYISNYLISVYETSPKTRYEARLERRIAGRQLAADLGVSIQKIWLSYAHDVYPDQFKGRGKR